MTDDCDCSCHTCCVPQDASCGDCEEEHTDAYVESVARAIAGTRTDCDPNHPCEACQASARAALAVLSTAPETETEEELWDRQW